MGTTFFFTQENGVLWTHNSRRSVRWTRESGMGPVNRLFCKDLEDSEYDSDVGVL